MKFLRFPPRPPAAGRDDRDATVRPIAARFDAANGPAAGARGPRGFEDDGFTDPRLLVALGALQRHSIESLLARRTPARRVLAAFRSQTPFAMNDPADHSFS